MYLSTINNNIYTKKEPDIRGDHIFGVFVVCDIFFKNKTPANLFLCIFNNLYYNKTEVQRKVIGVTKTWNNYYRGSEC